MGRTFLMSIGRNFLTNIDSASLLGSVLPSLTYMYRTFLAITSHRVLMNIDSPCLIRLDCPFLSSPSRNFLMIIGGICLRRLGRAFFVLPKHQNRDAPGSVLYREPELRRVCFQLPLEAVAYQWRMYTYPILLPSFLPNLDPSVSLTDTSRAFFTCP